ncbi:MAG: hypothetical protein JW702_02545, partial [Clostridiales bacterium]|nr:hypothetical protein [Clostridiales bacterium]
MKKWFNAYLTFIIGLGTLISIYAFATEKFSISILFIVVLIAVTLAESFAMLYNKNFAFSLSGSILILAAFNMDLIEIVVIGILHEVISKPIYKYFQDINYKLIDKKLFFNIGAKIIALTIVYLVIEKLKFLSMSFNYFIVLAMIIIGYYFLSHLLVNIVVYLYTGDKNQLKFNFKQESLYLYFFTIVTIVMEYGYLAFGIIGFIVLIGLILPLQSTMLNLTIAAETRQKQIRDRLTNAYNQAYLEE